MSSSALAMPLDEHCVISILNRTVQVGPGGNWAMPNIPATMGRIRARATCVVDGITASGQSDYFSITANGVVDVGPIYFDDPDPIPVTLRSTQAGTLSFTALGQRKQLNLQARYADSSSRDVTAASHGINYLSSNTNIVSIDADGLTTATGSGSVLITARKDGVIALIPMLVALGGDSDGDGLSDEYERAHGLNPADPVDALEDQDGDGLSALAEYQAGTDPQNADSDGDGIKDGEELEAGDDGYITDPLNADSDFDRIPDGIEIQTNTNPTDNQSYDFSLALTGIKVSPESKLLYYNTIDGETPYQLTVTGTLIDGSTLNLTADSNYLVSNVSLVGFSATPGEIFPANDGQAEITVSHSGYSATAYVIVKSIIPSAKGSLALPGQATNVAIAGTTAYLSMGTSGLLIASVTDADNPIEISTLPLPGNSQDIQVQDGIVYIANGEGLITVDVSEPLSPKILGSYITGNNGQDLVIKGDLAYIATGIGGLVILDISNPASPQPLGQQSLSHEVIGVDADAGLAVLVGGGQLSVVDVSNTASPQLQGNMAISDIRDVGIKNGYAHVAAHSTGFVSVDLQDPANPVLSSVPVTDFQPTDIAFSRDKAMFAETRYIGAILYADISNPEDTRFAGVIDFPGGADCNGIAASDYFAYCTTAGVLHVTQLRGLEDEFGIAPTVQIQSASASTELTRGEVIEITVQATDDVGIGLVKIYVNGELKKVLASAPYRFIHYMSEPVGGLTISAEATDIGGNIGTAEQTYTLNIGDAIDVVDTWEGEQTGSSTAKVVDGGVAMLNAVYSSEQPLTINGGVVIVGGGTTHLTASVVNIEGDLVILEGNLELSVTQLNVSGKVWVREGYKLTHPAGYEGGLHVVANQIIVEAGGKIDVSGMGLSGEGNSRAGGSHGGRGAAGRGNIDWYSAPVTDLLHTPALPGGGGSFSSYGGGVLRLSATELVVDGGIYANGEQDTRSGVNSSGAGGAIWLDVTHLSGRGEIRADGGIASDSNYQDGAGGGGRIAIYYAQADDGQGGVWDFTTQVVARGGSHPQIERRGAAGTVYIKKHSDTLGHIIVSNGSIRTHAQTELDGLLGEQIEVVNAALKVRDGAQLTGSVQFTNSDLVLANGLNNILGVFGPWIGAGQLSSETGTLDFGNRQLDLQGKMIVGLLKINELIVRANSVLTHPKGKVNGLHVIAERVVIEAGGRIDVSGMGLSGEGNSRAGGSHGGRGAAGRGHVDWYSAPVTDSLHTPALPGGGGSFSSYGGGVLRLSATELVVDGGIYANGEQDTRSGINSSGAGGAIWLDVTHLSGRGEIRADGGIASDSNYQDGAGGGGRIAIYYAQADDGQGGVWDFTTQVVARGGSHPQIERAGGAGTIYLKDTTQVTNYGELRISNSGIAAPAGSTPFRSLGRHPIVSISAASVIDGVTEWAIPVSGVNWEISDPTDPESVFNGLSVDLDASDLADPLYKVHHNTADTLYIRTNDDLRIYDPNDGSAELIGVYRFDSVTITDGASADFGSDRVEGLQ